MMCDVGESCSADGQGSAERVRVLVASDLHQRRSLYDGLHDAVAESRPDALVLLGDFLHGFELETDMMTVTECARSISALRTPQVVLVRGNHEGLQFMDFAEEISSTDRPLTTLHGEAAQVGKLTMVGFPCLLGDETAFTFTKPPLPSTPGAWLPALVRKLGPAGRAIWLMHEPPAGTKLSERSGPLAGSIEWTAMIERFAPRLALCGHDHQTPMRVGTWHDRIGDTAVVNVGQSDGERLHHTLIDATFVDGVAALPHRIRVRAYPWQEELVWGADGWSRQAVSVGEPDRKSGGRVVEGG